MMTEVRDQYAFIDLLTGYQPAMVIMAAHRLGVFAALTGAPGTAADLAQRLETDPSSLGALLRGLASIGLAQDDDGVFGATDFVRDHLAGSGDLELVIEKEEYFAGGWMSLPQAVRTGQPVLPPWGEIVERDPSTASMFLEALDVLARHTGPALWELPELAPGRRVLDVGGGLGHYARRIAAAGSEVTLVDLPEVIEAVRDRFGGSDAIRLVGYDVLAAPGSCGVAPGSFDAALVSHMLHDLDADTAAALLGSVRNALRPGGSLVVNDFAGEAGPGSFGPMFDIMMRVETGGAAHMTETLIEMATRAGFEDVQILPTQQPITMLTGVAP